jgi:hypothetical protein
MLAGNIFKTQKTQWPFLQKVFDAQTTSAYLITREFAPNLQQNLEESCSLLEKHFLEYGEKKHDFCLDIYWKKLQPQSNWFVLHPKLGMQREGFSDIEQRKTNYKV